MAETFTAADLQHLLTPNHPLRRGVTLVAPDRETAAGLREVAGVRVRVRVARKVKVVASVQSQTVVTVRPRRWREAAADGLRWLWRRLSGSP